MEKREKIDVYFKMNGLYYLLFSVIQMKDNGIVDLKITNYYNGIAIKNANLHNDGTLSEDEMNATTYNSKAEISYHADGSYLNKVKDFNIIKYQNPYGKDVRWTPTDKIIDFQPIINIQIHRMELYNKGFTYLPVNTSKRKSYICSCDELFDINGTYFLLLFIRNKSLPFCRCGNSQYHSDVITELNSQLDLCIFIQRHSFPIPKPYYSIHFKTWITRCAFNSINFCNKEYSKDEIMDKFGKTLFNPNLCAFLKILNDGDYYYFSEDKLKVIDAIEDFYSSSESKKISKPLFMRTVLDLLGDQISLFNTFSTINKVQILSNIYANLHLVLSNDYN